MPVHRRSDDEDIGLFNLFENGVQLVSGQVLSIGIDPVIDEIQRLIGLIFKEFRSHLGRISIFIGASVNK